MASRQTWGNVILDAMPEREFAKFLAQLEHIELGIKDVSQEPGEPVRKVFFPVDCVFSVVANTDDGGVVEVATMGSEGLAGLSVFLGHAQSTLTAFSQIPGAAWSTSAEYFRDAVNNGSWLRQVLQLYTHCLMLQISQGVICNARHDVTQRCARWLLMSLDRVKRRDFQLTQEFLAQMLAVGRGSVNQVATRFQAQGIIRYSRGRMSILKPELLREITCECYDKIADEYKRFGREIRRM
ncbi:MAG TPA: Crp/Fnr family transcriptional regulator [Bryobacteraceae bacterium]|nr:Crp/Fnr family transcriptional regulator [Bryobacteraceae bacterium]